MEGVFMKSDLSAEQYLKKVLSTEVIDEQCPVHRTLNILNGKWKTHIIFELCKHDSLRFGELKKLIPKITNSMLTSTLKDLEELGIIDREQFNEIPPHVEYSLTSKGKELIPIFVEISKWGETNLD
ncbi:winged helix-turn-helix transcriptional regulator [Thomasclavelia saccharogumia]|uniref:winged helix-turn-helix transcriptional regulator n=2 Tax=Thomasclavelia saccharogumia TaxID=341225 RepID=UPI001C9BE624|nr:helix-turn-helix domain-containing protein [Thomasclavelia saccharogumia]